MSYYQLGAKFRQDFGERQHFKVFMGEIHLHRLKKSTTRCKVILCWFVRAPAQAAVVLISSPEAF